jgi:hypothetical protein
MDAVLAISHKGLFDSRVTKIKKKFTIKNCVTLHFDIKESSLPRSDKFSTHNTSNYSPNHTASHPKHMNLQQHRYKNLKSFLDLLHNFRQTNLQCTVKYFIIDFNSTTHVRHLYGSQVKTNASIIADGRSGFFSLCLPLYL